MISLFRKLLKNYCQDHIWCNLWASSQNMEAGIHKFWEIVTLSEEKVEIIPDEQQQHTVHVYQHPPAAMIDLLQHTSFSSAPAELTTPPRNPSSRTRPRRSPRTRPRRTGSTSPRGAEGQSRCLVKWLLFTTLFSHFVCIYRLNDIKLPSLSLPSWLIPSHCVILWQIWKP